MLMQFCKDLVYKLSEEKMKVKRFIGGSLEENSYVVYRKTGGECYIIDPGHSADKILKFIKEEKLSPKGILLTHHHYDHTDAVDKIRESRELPVFLHREDLDMYGNDVDVILEGDDVLMLDNEAFTVIHTPGHTGGSVCYYFEESKIIFTGDTLFCDDIGRTDFKDSDDRRMHKSCHRLSDLLSGDTTVYPGHDNFNSMKAIRKINSYFNEYAGVK